MSTSELLSKRSALVLSVAALIAGLLLLALSPPAGADVFKFIPHGVLSGNLNAPTDFRSTNGCLDRDVMVIPVDSTDGSSFALAGVFVFDHCSGTQVEAHSGIADLVPADFQIDQARTSASLSATVPTFDELANTDPPTPAAPLEIHLSWTGIGPLLPPQMVRFATGHNDGVTVVNLDHESCRNATVSGSVTDDSINYAEGGTANTQLCQQIAGSKFLFVDVQPQ